MLHDFHIQLCNDRTNACHSVKFAIAADSYRDAVIEGARHAMAMLPIAGFSQPGDIVIVDTATKTGDVNDYSVLAAYSSNPEDGDWADAVQAVDPEDAEIITRLYLAHELLDTARNMRNFDLEKLFRVADGVRIIEISLSDAPPPNTMQLLKDLLAEVKDPASPAAQAARSIIAEWEAPPAKA